MEIDFKKLNDEPIAIEYVEDDHEEDRDFQPSFWFENRRHFMDDFVRAHNNPWVCGEWPEFIHGMEVGVYHNPLFVEIVNGGDAVNVVN